MNENRIKCFSRSFSWRASLREPTFRSSSSPRFGDGSLRPSRASDALDGARGGGRSRARVHRARHDDSAARPLRPLARRAVAAPAASSSDRAGDASSSGTTGRLVDPTGDASRREKAPKARAKAAAARAWRGRACRGTGALAAGGFHAKNPRRPSICGGHQLDRDRRTEGWRHFEAVGKSPADKANGKPHATVLLAATCDRDVTVWVSVRELKDRQLWSAGWKQREDLEWTGDPNAPGGAVARPKAGTTCVKCMGDGTIPCERKGCAMGAERVRKQEEVVAKARQRSARPSRSRRTRRRRATTTPRTCDAACDDNSATCRAAKKKTMRRRGKTARRPPRTRRGGGRVPPGP